MRWGVEQASPASQHPVDKTLHILTARLTHSMANSEGNEEKTNPWPCHQKTTPHLLSNPLSALTPTPLSKKGLQGPEVPDTSISVNSFSTNTVNNLAIVHPTYLPDWITNFLGPHRKNSSEWCLWRIPYALSSKPPTSGKEPLKALQRVLASPPPFLGPFNSKYNRVVPSTFGHVSLTDTQAWLAVHVTDPLINDVPMSYLFY